MKELREALAGVRFQLGWAKSIIELEERLSAAIPFLEEAEKLETRIQQLTGVKATLVSQISELRAEAARLESANRARADSLDEEFAVKRAQAEDRYTATVDVLNVRLREKQVEVEGALDSLSQKQLHAQQECEAVLAALADARRRHDEFLASIGAKR